MEHGINMMPTEVLGASLSGHGIGGRCRAAETDRWMTVGAMGGLGASRSNATGWSTHSALSLSPGTVCQSIRELLYDPANDTWLPAVVRQDDGSTSTTSSASSASTVGMA